MSKLPNSNNYVDSNIMWIGAYPSRWNLTQVKYEAYVKARVGWHGLKSDDFTDEGPYLVTGSDFKSTNISWSDCYHCDLKRYEQDPYIQLKNGDLLITKDGTIGKVALVQQLAINEKATLNSGVFVVRPLESNFLSGFYFWLLQSRVFTDFVDYNKTGSTIVHLYQDTFVNFSYASPKFKEQTQIAAFLDHETAKIDTLIDKQQQLIELLKEKRQAVISHAVTKGLDPDVPMKDSGVEWLGEVPEHWKVIYIKHLSEVKRGASPRPIDDQKYFDEEGEYAWTRIADVSLAGMYLKDTQQRLSSLGSSLSVKLERGELFLSIAGTVGKPCITTSKACIHDGFVYFPSLKINNKYLFYIFDAGQAYLGLGKMGTQLNLNTDTVGCIKVALPPSLEIHEIVSYIVKQKEKYDLLITSAYEFIELIQERRTALISAAVTGKIDVRDWQVPVTQTESDEVMA
jgi:type I restriction enzyme, S subunit